MSRGARAAALAVMVLAGLGGCSYKANIPRCSVRCGAASACPSDTRCNEQDGYCHAAGDTAACGGGGCTAANCPAGTGICRNDACCTGCWDGQTCIPTDAIGPDLCGQGGELCNVCNASECNEAVCNAGVCETMPAAGTCATGVCVDGSCRCGSTGQPCCAGNSCTDGSTCNGNTCGQCGALNQPCCSNNTCASGICQSNTCRACGGHAEPCCPPASGSGMGTCQSGFVCNASSICECGALNQPCCSASVGNPCDAPINVCFNGTCRVCGGRDQVCCTGGTCNIASLSCQTNFCQCFPQTGATGCNGTQTCDRNSCNDLVNCRNVIGMCNYCPARCEEGGLVGQAGLMNSNCTGAVNPPCDNCDASGKVFCTVNAPFPGCTLNPNYCFTPQ